MTSNNNNDIVISQEVKDKLYESATLGKYNVFFFGNLC